MIGAFIFDMDGVLTDTARVSVALVRSYFSTFGWSIDNATVVKNLGKGLRGLFGDSASAISKEIDIDDALSYSRRVYPEMMKSVSPVRGAVELVKKARECGIKTAVASSAPEWRVKANIKSMGLGEEDFDLVLSDRDIIRNKPFPDIYLLSCIRLGVSPKDALVFEDSLSGIASANAAGIRCVALLTSIGREEAEKSGAAFIFDTLSSFPDFEGAEDLENTLLKRKGAKKYGANWIIPALNPPTMEDAERKAVEEARKAMHNAYCPYSKFRVGAAVLSAASGRIYSGCNMENASYGATICAERNAITTAVTNEGTIGIDLVVISSECNPPAQPCAVCLQVMSEFIRPETPIVLVSEEGCVERYHYSDLLPHPFEFGDEQ